MLEFTALKIFELIRNQEPIRVVAIGSSNTQRRITGMHWFDYVELGFRQNCGKGCGQFINSGVGGNTTFDLLRRFDMELAIYQPHLVIMTMGGNDSHPTQNIGAQEFRDNLNELGSRIRGLGSELILQTFYACDQDNLDLNYAATLRQYMQIIRETAEAGSYPLAEHFNRWDRLRMANVGLYRSLMRDPMHVNALGNMVMGLDLLRRFDLKINDEPYCREGLFVQMILDQLESLP